MEILSGTNTVGAFLLADPEVTIVEAPVVGKPRARRVTTTARRMDNRQVLSVLIEEFNDGTLRERVFEQFSPLHSVCREVFEKDGTLISSETERKDASGLLTKVVSRGAGKSSTTRILCGEFEARATERIVLVETPRASYSYHPFDGRWTAFYKDMGLKFELKSNFLKNPNSSLLGPDGITLVFRNSRLVDMSVA